MTQQQLESRIGSINQISYGHWSVQYWIRGGEGRFITTNSQAVDRIRFRDSYMSDRDASDATRYTLKQAYQALWNEATR